jgi:cell division protein FtsW (lipid II flippase)
MSYGGSNLVIMLTSIGLLLSIARLSAEPAAVEAPKETDV